MDNEKERIEALLKDATPEAATMLTEMAEQTQSKEMRKAARRALYLLGVRGIKPVPVAADSIIEAKAVDTLRAYATNYDGAGNRILFFEIASPEGGKVTAVQMMTNDLTGLQASDSSRLSSRDLHHRLQHLEQMQSEGLGFVEIPADYGRWLLAESREVLRRQNKKSPSGVLELLPRIGIARRDYLVSPVYEAIPVEKLGDLSETDRDPAALFALVWFENWFFAVEDVMRTLHDWEKLIEMSADFEAEEIDLQRNAIVREMTITLFTPEIRRHYVRRLEETADILWRLSHETEARLALVHAQALAGERPIADVPFAYMLVERTLGVALAMMQEKRMEQEGQG